MKLIIDLDEYDYSTIVNDERYMPLDISVAINNGTPIPDNATNGDVIKAMFKPNHVERTEDNVIVEEYMFDKEWWNVPYQKGGKE